MDEQPVSQAASPATLRIPLTKPLFTWILLGINVAVFAVMTLAGGSESTAVLVRFGAKVNSLIATGQYWRFITPMFMHVGLVHLAFNSYALYVIGPEVERVFGRMSFLAIYLVAGIGGVVASFALNNNLSAGASGAIFGLIGAQGVFFLRYHKAFGRAGRRQLSNILLVIGLNLAFGFMYPGIDNHSHLGGLLVGALLGFALSPDYKVIHFWDGQFPRVLDVRSLKRRLALALPVLLALVLAATVAVRAQGGSFGVHMQQGQQLLDGGDFQGALAEFKEAGRLAPGVADAFFMQGYVYSQQHDYADAASAFERAVTLDNTVPEARWNLAVSYAVLGRSADARDQLQAYLLLDISSADRQRAVELMGELGLGSD